MTPTEGDLSAENDRDFVAYLEVTIRLSHDLFDGETQKDIAEWLDDEYPSLAGFVADHPVLFAMARISNPRDKLQDYQRVIGAWRTEQSDGDRRA